MFESCKGLLWKVYGGGKVRQQRLLEWTELQAQGWSFDATGTKSSAETHWKPWIRGVVLQQKATEPCSN